MMYLFNIFEKDFKIDPTSIKFNVNKKHILFTQNEKEDELQNNFVPLDFQKESFKTDYRRAFNNCETMQIESKYIPYEKKELNEEEIEIHNHQLWNLPHQLIKVIKPSKDHGVEKAFKDRWKLYKTQKTEISQSSQNVSTFTQQNESNLEKLKSINLNLKKEGSIKNAKRRSLRESQKTLRQQTLINEIENKILPNVFINNIIDTLSYEKLNQGFLDPYSFLFTSNKTKKTKKENVKKKATVLDNNIEILKIFKFDKNTMTRKYIDWSGEDILEYKNSEENYEKLNKIITNLEYSDVVLWSENVIVNFFQRIRCVLYIISNSIYFEYAVFLIVIANSIVLSFSGNLFDETYYGTIFEAVNDIFTYIFLGEFLVKIIGLGVKDYYFDITNLVDFCVLVIGFTDIYLRSLAILNSAQKINVNLSVVKVLRIFRIFRVLRLLRNIQAMRMIMRGLFRSLINIIYVMLFLVIFIFIFMNLGMSLFKDCGMFSSILNTFYIVFAVLSIENWNSTLYVLVQYQSLFSVIYLIIWVILGNWVVFNLFLAVILNSFEPGKNSEYELGNIMNTPETFKKLALMEVEITKSSLKNGIEENEKDENEKENESDHDNSEDEEYNNEEDYERKLFLKNKLEDVYIPASERKLIENEINFLIFNKIECEISLFLFSKTNCLRKFLTEIATNKNFDRAILIVITLTFIRIIIDSFVLSGQVIFASFDLGVCIIMIAEFVAKIIALGFVMDENSYLRDNWNKLDFIVLIIQLIDLQSISDILTNQYQSLNSNQYLKVVRMLRILRPLRFISQNKEMKIIILSIAESFSSIFNLFLILILIAFIFALSGILIFYDLYKSCMIPSSTSLFQYTPVQNFTEYVDGMNLTFPYDRILIEQICSSTFNGYMDKYPAFTFFNITDSLITIFVLFNTESWPDFMNSYREYDNTYGIFFILTILIGNFIFLNLFQGVLFGSFSEAYREQKEKGIHDRKETEFWWTFLNQRLEEQKPEYMIYTAPNNYYQKNLFRFINDKKVEYFFLLNVLLNTIILAMNFSDSTDDYNRILSNLNLVFTAVFFLEFILKLFANGLRGYFFGFWNYFDFIIILTSIIDITLTFTGNTGNNTFLTAFQTLRIMRILRMAKLLKLIKSLKMFQRLILIIKWSLFSLVNMAGIIILIYSIFSILGFYIFEDIVYNDINSKNFTYVSEFFNFNNYYFSMWTVFRSVTGENWPYLMNEYVKASYKVKGLSYHLVIFYYLAMIIICQYIFLNLFLAIGIQRYSDFYENPENPIEKFYDLLENFKVSWNKYASDKHDGMKMKVNNLILFFKDLNGDFSESYEKENENSIKKYIVELQLFKDSKNYFYFNEVLYKMVKFNYGKFHNKPLAIKKEEKRTYERILDQIEKDKSMRMIFNPLSSHLIYCVSFQFLKAFITNYSNSLDIIKINRGPSFFNRGPSLTKLILKENELPNKESDI